MTKVYAVAQSVPRPASHLTAGSRYEVLLHGECGRSFWVEDDDGDRAYCLWRNDPNLNGGNWTRIEDEEPAAEATADATIAALKKALGQAADNLAAAAKLYDCPGAHRAEQIARAALAGSRE